jgi:hypothetical protein
VRVDFSSLSKQLFQTEGMLGVTKRAGWLRKQGYTVGSTDYDDINAKLYRNQVDVARLQSRCSILRSSAKKFGLICREVDGDGMIQGTEHQLASNRITEVDNVVQRLDIDLSELEYAQKRLQSQFSILYNLINQRDSRLNYKIAAASKDDSTAMKTISVLTLVFLPATFVSTVFSTSIFNFQNWQSGNSLPIPGQPGGAAMSVVSRGWWIYLLCCVLLTVLVAGTWYICNRWDLKRYNEFDIEHRSSLGDPRSSIESGLVPIESGIQVGEDI